MLLRIGVQKWPDFSVVMVSVLASAELWAKRYTSRKTDSAETRTEVRVTILLFK